MKASLSTLIAGAIMAAVAAPAGAQAPAPAPAPVPGAPYAVTYLEVMPSAKADAIKLIKEVAAASRKEPGNLRFEVLQRMDRDNQFAILEAWNDPKAREAHESGSAMTQFRDKLKPLRSGPYDERPSLPITVAPPATAGTPGAVYVVTHVDVAPPFKDATIDLLKAFVDDSRKEPSSVRLEVWQQNNRSNHFTVTEIWKDRPAVDSHIVTASTKDFREKLGPMSGALFDDRIYKSIE
jgi:quinol monooxygenase YgiN